MMTIKIEYNNWCVRQTHDTSTTDVTHTMLLSLRSPCTRKWWVATVRVDYRNLEVLPPCPSLSMTLFLLCHSSLSPYNSRLFPLDLLFARCTVFRQSSIAGVHPLRCLRHVAVLDVFFCQSYLVHVFFLPRFPLPVRLSRVWKFPTSAVKIKSVEID